MAQVDGSADAAVEMRLERALLWRAAGGCPGWALSGALLAHAVVLGGLWLALPLAWDVVAGGPGRGMAPVFTAPVEEAAPRKRPAALVGPALFDRFKLPPHGEFPRPVPNLSAIQLSFSDDVGGRLPQVLAEQHGMLALLDKDDPSIARYLFHAPGWDGGETVEDVSRLMCLWMEPAERWAVLRELARRHGIALDHYRAGALFDIGYRRCLQDAIGGAAERQWPGSAAPVRGARLAFAAERPCGVEVLEVTLESRLDRRPR